MPITQTRMLDLLHAAQDFKQAFEDMFEQIAHQTEQVRIGAITAELALGHIGMTVKPEFMLSRPLESGTTIALETKHFSSVARKNVKSAAWQKHKRELIAAGLPIPKFCKTAHSNTAPKHIRKEPKVKPSVHRQIVLAEAEDKIESWAEKASKIKRDIAADDDLELEGVMEVAEPVPVFKPGVISDERKAQIEREGEELEAQRVREEEYFTLYGDKDKPA